MTNTQSPIRSSKTITVPHLRALRFSLVFLIRSISIAMPMESQMRRVETLIPLSHQNPQRFQTLEMELGLVEDQETLTTLTTSPYSLTATTSTIDTYLNHPLKKTRLIINSKNTSFSRIQASSYLITLQDISSGYLKLRIVASLITLLIIIISNQPPATALSKTQY